MIATATSCRTTKCGSSTSSSPVSASTCASCSDPCSSAIAARCPWMRPCRAAWPSRRAFQRAVQQPQRQVVSLRRPQHRQRRNAAVVPARWQAGRERRLHLRHSRRRRPPRRARRAVDPGDGLERGWPAPAPEGAAALASPARRRGTAVVTINSSDAELERALRGRRARAPRQRRQRLGAASAERPPETIAHRPSPKPRKLGSPGRRRPTAACRCSSAASNCIAATS